MPTIHSTMISIACAAFLAILESAQGYDDARNIHAAMIYAMIISPFIIIRPRSFRGAVGGLVVGCGVVAVFTFIKFMNPISALGILLVTTVGGIVATWRAQSLGGSEC